MSHKKFGPDRFSRLDVYWIQTDRQTDIKTDRQAKFIYRFLLNKNVQIFNSIIINKIFLQNPIYSSYDLYWVTGERTMEMFFIAWFEHSKLSGFTFLGENS